jgi:hypothetical protein
MEVTKEEPAATATEDKPAAPKEDVPESADQPKEE